MDKPKTIRMPDGSYLDIKGGTKILIPTTPNPQFETLSLSERIDNKINQLNGYPYIPPFYFKQYTIAWDAVKEEFFAVFDKDIYE